MNESINSIEELRMINENLLYEMAVIKRNKKDTIVEQLSNKESSNGRYSAKVTLVKRTPNRRKQVDLKNLPVFS